MITIKALLFRYHSGVITPKNHIDNLLKIIRKNVNESIDSAWISIATDDNIASQLRNLESLAKEKAITDLPLYGIPFCHQGQY